MGFDDEVRHNRSSKDTVERLKAERRAASGSRSTEEYESALQEALAHLSRLLHPTKALLEKRMIRADVYTPDGFILYRHRDTRGGRGIKVEPSPYAESFVDMLTTDGQVWSRSYFGPAQFLSSGKVLSLGHVFGLTLSVDIDGHLTARPSNRDEPWKPFREHLVSLCAAAPETHTARA